METLFIGTFIVFIRQAVVSYWSNWEIPIHDLRTNFLWRSCSSHNWAYYYTNVHIQCWHAYVEVHKTSPTSSTSSTFALTSKQQQPRENRYGWPGSYAYLHVTIRCYHFYLELGQLWRGSMGWVLYLPPGPWDVVILNTFTCILNLP